MAGSAAWGFVKLVLENDVSKQRVEIYFDFTSPYGYLGSELVEGLAERCGLDVEWRPFLLGAAFKVAGTGPFMNVPLKGDYAKRDLERTAREHGIPFTLCDVFALKQVAASRAVTWTRRDAPEKTADLVHAIYRFAFVEGGNFSEAETVADLAAGVGLDRDSALSAMNDPAIKDRLREDVEAAVDRGVFGSPVFFFGEEPFWGVDHMEQLERWIARGGW